MLPTPAVALLAQDLGAVVTASHNPAEFNGVKFFDGDGHKLVDAQEEEIEALLDAPANGRGSVEHVEGAAASYVEHILDAVRLRPERSADRGRLRERRVQRSRPGRRSSVSAPT